MTRNPRSQFVLSPRSIACVVPGVCSSPLIESLALTLAHSQRSKPRSELDPTRRRSLSSSFTESSHPSVAPSRINQRPCEARRLSPTTLFPKS